MGGKTSSAVVSTHMPLARHDDNTRRNNVGNDVSTHMPLARHDVFASAPNLATLAFLLTCLLRGMTVFCGVPGDV